MRSKIAKVQNARSRVRLQKKKKLRSRIRKQMNRSKARLVLETKIGLDFRNLRENRRRRGRNDTKP
jgi:hypothetical protein